MTRGVYQPCGIDFSDEDLFRSAALRVGNPSAICLLSALSYYELTDSIPKKVWTMVPKNKRTAFLDLRLFRSRNPEWKIGIVEKNGFRITSIERTVVNALTYKKQLGTSTAVEALRKAVQSKKTTAGKVLEMAKALGVLPYIEGVS